MDLSLNYYLSGPMSGYPDHNYPAFEAACKDLRSMGMKVASPHEFTTDEKPGDWEYLDYINRDLEIIEKHCQGVILLPDWAGSKGVVQHELPLAQKLNLPVYLYIPALFVSSGMLKFMGGGRS